MKSGKMRVWGIKRLIGLGTAVFLTGGMFQVSSLAKTSGAAFLKIAPSVRNHALGGSHPALSFGSRAIGSNPGNIVLQKAPCELTTTFASLIGDSGFGHVAGTYKSNSRAWGVHVTYLRSGNLEGRDEAGLPTSTFSGQDMSAGVSFAQRVGRKVRMGVTAKGVRQSIGSETSNTALGIDAGLSVATSRALFGAAVNNVGSEIKFRKEGSDLPSSVSGGVALETGDVTTVLGVGHWMNEKETYVNGGMEYRLGGAAFRVGYRSETGKNLALKAQDGGEQVLNGLTGGLAFERGSWKIDYAIAQTAVEYGISHRLAMTWSFGQERDRGAGPHSRKAARVGQRWVK